MEITSPKQTLLNTFRGIRLEDSTHTYYVGKKKYPSSTTSIVGKFANKFDEQKMSKLVAAKEGVTQEEILARWAAIREEACERGSLVHKCMEYVPFSSYDEALAILEDKLTEPEFVQLFNEKELRQVSSGIKWYNWLRKKYGDKYEVLVLELMMFMPEFLHCGTADIILLNKETGKLVIADWKTNKDLFQLEYYKNRRKKYFKYPFKELLDCPHSKYILQFSHYQMMIEKRTHLEVEDRWCIWLTDDNIVEGYAHKGDGWVQYNTPNYSKTLYHHYKQNLATDRPKSLADLLK